MRNIVGIPFGLLMALIVACGQVQIKTPKSAMTKFTEFISQEKFVQDDRFFYQGIRDSTLRPILTEKINLAAGDFKKLADKGNVTDKEYQAVIKVGLDRFSNLYLQLDTEDRERVCHYFEELMDIVGLESSGGHLNMFMYEFDPSKKK